MIPSVIDIVFLYALHKEHSDEVTQFILIETSFSASLPFQSIPTIEGKDLSRQGSWS